MKLGIVPGSVLVLALVICAPDLASGQDLYWINGTDMGAVHNHVQVYGPDDAVEDATVTLNGHDLSNGGSGGTYSGQLNPEVAVGANLNLVIEADGEMITAVGVVPEPPIVTSPAENESFGTSEFITVEWTSSTDPDRFSVRLNSDADGLRWNVAGDERSLVISADQLAPDLPITISVFSYTDGEFTGPVDESSSMNIRGTAWETVTISVPVEGESLSELKGRYR